MKLPTVLMTDVIRSAKQGDAHGGAYLINLETGDHHKVLDWNRIDIEWSGRGMGRGLRGIVFRDEEIWIAASDELFVFDREFKIVRSYRCPALHHCHEIRLDDDGRIWLTSTSFDALIRFDPKSESFDLGIHIAPAQREQDGQPIGVLEAHQFDPTDPTKLPPKKDRLHINQVWWMPKMILFSGLRLRVACGIDLSTLQIRPIGVTPEMTHNCQIHEGRLLFNSSGEDALVIAGSRGREIQRMPIPDLSERATNRTAGDFARAGFARGLCVDPSSGCAIVGHSPGSVTAFDLSTGAIRTTVTVAEDIRNAPHGLEIWPFVGD
ncbi:MAG: hypothetical protein AB8F26_01930 [Phycisphaerales bacterium]